MFSVALVAMNDRWREDIAQDQILQLAVHHRVTPAIMLLE
jgi:hypothetical protein